MTKRQAALSLGIVAVGTFAAVMAAVDIMNLADAALALLTTAGLILLIDVRRRQGDLAARLKNADKHTFQVRRRQEDVMKRLQGSSLAAIAGNQWATRKELRERISTAKATVLGSVETERLDAEDRHREAIDHFRSLEKQLVSRADTATTSLQGTIEAAVSSTSQDFGKVLSQEAKNLSRTIQKGVEQAKKASRDETREFEALLQLYRAFEPRAPMPPSGRWAMNATSLLHLVALIKERRPKLVLELGSGASTIWIAYALEAVGSGEVLSVDHEQEFAEITTQFLRYHELERYAQVRIAPLERVEIDTQEYRWYEQRAFEDVSRVDLLVVDGPPGTAGNQARYPALPLLSDRLSDHAAIALDDASREDEQQILERWTNDTAPYTRRVAVGGDIAILTVGLGASGASNE